MKKCMILTIGFLCACTSANPTPAQSQGTTSSLNSHVPSESEAPVVDQNDVNEIINQFNSALEKYDYAKAYHIVHDADIDENDPVLNGLIHKIDLIVNEAKRCESSSHDLYEDTLYEYTIDTECIYDWRGLITYRSDLTSYPDGFNYRQTTYYDYYPDSEALKQTKYIFSSNGETSDPVVTNYDFSDESSHSEPIVTIDGNRKTEIITNNNDSVTEQITSIYENDQLIREECLYIDHINLIRSKNSTAFTYDGDVLIQENTVYENNGGGTYTIETNYVEHDALGHPTRTEETVDYDTYAVFTIYQYEYDHKGRIIYTSTRQTYSDDTQEIDTQESWYEYDSQDHLVRLVHRNGSSNTVIENEFDKYGRIVSYLSTNYEDGSPCYETTITYTYMALD